MYKKSILNQEPGFKTRNGDTTRAKQNVFQDRGTI